MNEASSIFTSWHDFYVISGSSAAALTGLMFVVVSLSAGGRTRTNVQGFSVFSSPTVVHFCAAFLIAAAAAVPWRTPVAPATIFALAGLYGVAYIVRITYQVKKQTVYQPDYEDWMWFCILPLFAYVVTTVSAVYVSTGDSNALFELAGAVLLLIFIGIHNAWDVVTYIAITLPAQEATDNESSSQRDEQPS